MSADLWKNINLHSDLALLNSVLPLSFSQASQPDELTIDEHEMLEVIEDGDMEDWVKVNQSNLCLFQQFNTTCWSSFQDCNSIRSTEEKDFCVSCNVKNKIYTWIPVIQNNFLNDSWLNSLENTGTFCWILSECRFHLGLFMSFNHFLLV